MIPWTTIIANALENGFGWEPQEIAKHLREAQAKIEELEKRPAINKEDGLVCAKCYGSFKQNPLTKEEIDDLVHEHNLLDDYPYDFVRAMEERHGIK